jgi:hypothetical protein
VGVEAEKVSPSLGFGMKGFVEIERNVSDARADTVVVEV